MSTVLVIAPHPDDETLGCGGTRLRHLNQGDQVHWLIMSTIDGMEGYALSKVEQRNTEINRVADYYGFASTQQLSFSTTLLDHYPRAELVEAVSTVVKSCEPEIIYLPFRGDVHSDHMIVFDVVASCVKSFRYPFIRKVRAYETLSETEFSIRPDSDGFKPNLWVDIDGYLDGKIEAMHFYQGEMGKHPFPRSEENIRALATFRGATAGFKAAEAFVSLFEIE